MSKIEHKKKYSVLIANLNGIDHLTKCIKSLDATTKPEDTDIWIFDNNSDDGSRSFLQELDIKRDNYHVICSDKKYNFAESNNRLLNEINSKNHKYEYIVYLNNDTEVYGNWLDQMSIVFEVDKSTGAVGPVTSMSNGKKQMVGQQNWKSWHEKNKGIIEQVGILYGWCIMVRHDLANSLGGFDERFINSYEDNDLSLRIQQLGYKLYVARDTYIYHAGQATIRVEYGYDVDAYKKNGYKMRQKYFDKHYPQEDQKLVAVMRLGHGCEPYIEEVLDHTAKFANAGIIVHLCRASDELKEIVKSHKSVVKIGYYEDSFQEDYERNWLLQEALEMQKQGKADWCISVDGDELYEYKFIDIVQDLMKPANPEILAYWCNWKTIWKRDRSQEYFRQDSTFGQFKNYRFFKLIPNQIIKSDHPEGHHCGSAPTFPEENLRWVNVRVKHLGYDTESQRQKKYEFYQKNDHFKSQKDIGYDDYSHLISPNPKLLPYYEDNGISLCIMVKNEEEYIEPCLEMAQYVVDEMIILDTGSEDNTISMIQQFAKRTHVPVKIIDFKWCDNYSLPRNIAKLHATKRYCLHLDADEMFTPPDIARLQDLIETDADFIAFHVMNYLENPNYVKDAKYAMTDAVRIYKNIPEIYYTGLLHETVDDAIADMRVYRKPKIHVAGFPLHHWGYLADKSKIKKKLDYYATINERQLELTAGTDARPYFNLALHYLEDDNGLKAAEYFHQALKINPKFWQCSQQLAAMNLKLVMNHLYQINHTLTNDHPFKKKTDKIINFLNDNMFGHQKVG